MSGELLSKEVFKNQIRRAFKEISITKNNKKESLIIVLLSLVLAVTISTLDKTVSNALKVTDIFLNAQLAVFACFFTAYSITITFLKDDYLNILYKSPDKDYDNCLNKVVTYYESISYLYFIGILTSVIYKVFLSIIDDSFMIFNCRSLNNFICASVLSLYFGYSIRILFELKSVIKNSSFILRVGLKYKLKTKGDEPK